MPAVSLRRIAVLLLSCSTTNQLTAKSSNTTGRTWREVAQACVSEPSRDKPSESKADGRLGDRRVRTRFAVARSAARKYGRWRPSRSPPASSVERLLTHKFPMRQSRYGSLFAFAYPVYRLSSTGVMAARRQSSSGCNALAPAMIVANPGPSAVGIPPRSR